MSEAINACPECERLQIHYEDIETYWDRVELVYVCPGCDLCFVTTLGNAVKEVEAWGKNA